MDRRCDGSRRSQEEAENFPSGVDKSSAKLSIISPTYPVLLLQFLYPLLRFLFKNKKTVDPSTPKSDQLQISPAASPEILHHTQMKDDTTNSPYPTCSHFSLNGWVNVLFEPQPTSKDALLALSSSSSRLILFALSFPLL